MAQTPSERGGGFLQIPGNINRTQGVVLLFLVEEYVYVSQKCKHFIYILVNKGNLLA